jgi:predicted dehydrogenase
MAGRSTRRTFLAAGGASIATAAARLHAAGANDRLGVGFVGVGNRGTQLMRSFLKQKDIDVVALCDVDRGILEDAAEIVARPAATLKDYRELVGRSDVDAVVIATPDHWHALQTIAACEAGKDVYVEKPLSITIVEGRAMVAAARRTRRIVQVGTHRRSSETYKRAVELVRGGGIGTVTVARAYRLSNMAPAGIGKAAPADPPAGLDWDRWLGPRPFEPYRATIHPYKFRWWDRYSSQAANWGVHYFDAIRWVVGAEAPRSVVALGGVYAVADDRTIPDTLEVTCELPGGCLVVFGQYEASGQAAIKGGDIEVRGTRGTAYVDEKWYEIVPERGGQFQDPAPRMDAVKVTGLDGDVTDQHVRNFLNCVWNRQRPHADVEEGHRSTTFSLLANIALAARARIEWDPAAERITSPAEANAFLHYEYRAPWKLPS